MMQHPNSIPPPFQNNLKSNNPPQRETVLSQTAAGRQQGTSKPTEASPPDLVAQSAPPPRTDYTEPVFTPENDIGAAECNDDTSCGCGISPILLILLLCFCNRK